jgi:hypothetical protein
MKNLTDKQFFVCPPDGYHMNAWQLHDIIAPEFLKERQTVPCKIIG